MDWEVIYKEHSPKVYQYLLSLCGNTHKAEDFLQETFIKAIRSEERLLDRAKVSSWLFSIARNLFLDAKRKTKRRKTDSVGEFNEHDIDLGTDIHNPEAHTIRADFRNQLKQTLSQLDESHRTAFILGVIQKIPYREIEAITGWSSVKVKSKIFRARRKVAAALADFQE